MRAEVSPQHLQQACYIVSAQKYLLMSQTSYISGCPTPHSQTPSLGDAAIPMARTDAELVPTAVPPLWILRRHTCTLTLNASVVHGPHRVHACTCHSNPTQNRQEKTSRPLAPHMQTGIWATKNLTVLKLPSFPYTSQHQILKYSEKAVSWFATKSSVNGTLGVS